jgi:hypothetical protein
MLRGAVEAGVTYLSLSRIVLAPTWAAQLGIELLPFRHLLVAAGSCLLILEDHPRSSRPFWWVRMAVAYCVFHMALAFRQY